MAHLYRFGLAVLLAVSFALPAQARDTAPANVAQGLVLFTSEEGIARLARSDAKADFAALANQFEPQSNATFCGPTSAAIVLNAVNVRSSSVPRDRSRLREEDFKYLPSGFEPALPRFTQDNVITQGRKTRAQVLGEPMEFNGKKINDYGYQLRQFDEMLRANNLNTQLTIVDDKLPEEKIRTELVASLKKPGDYVIVGYHRVAVGQKGGGHISPLGAYDAETDSFLVMDVNPSSAGWVWMPTATLIKGMRTFDTVENRGYIRVWPR